MYKPTEKKKRDRDSDQKAIKLRSNPSQRRKFTGILTSTLQEEKKNKRKKNDTKIVIQSDESRVKKKEL